MKRLLLGLVAAACVLGGAGPAWAVDTPKARASPSFLGGACMTTVERGTPTTFELGIPWEEGALTEQEPSDSRTFQFFALCRDPTPLEELPNWISQDDVSRSQAVNEFIEDPDPQDVLATASAWDPSCVVEMVSAADRIFIDCAATDGGFSWDGGSAAAGAHVVYGYTFEPHENVWTARQGVVRVVEPGQADAAGPAVAFSMALSSVDASFEGGIVVAGCLAGAPGTTITLSWALAPALADNGDAAWQPLAELEATDGTFQADFEPPAEAEFKAVFFRARVEDPAGQTFTAFTHHPVIFVPDCAEPRGGHYPTVDLCGVGGDDDWSTAAVSAVDCDGTMDPDTADATTDATTAGESASDGSESSGGTSPGQDESGGCGCRHAPPTGALWVFFLLRKRRR